MKLKPNEVKKTLLISVLPLLFFVILSPSLPRQISSEGLVSTRSNTYPQKHTPTRPSKVCSLTNPNITSIHIIGERNSGVDELFSILETSLNLPEYSKLLPSLKRGKFWFQHFDQTLSETSSARLVLVIIRNPYEFLLSMLEHPLHAPAHFSPKDWKKFVSKSWTVERSVTDKEISRSKEAHCQEEFFGRQVVPCRKGDPVINLLDYDEEELGYAVYEQKDGKPFKHIGELRRAKLVNWFNITFWMKNVEFVRVEELMEGNYISGNKVVHLINSLESQLGKFSCLEEKKETKMFQEKRYLKRFLFDEEFEMLRVLSRENLFKLKNIMPIENKEKKLREITEIKANIKKNFGFLRWITCNLHFSAEARFGYEKYKALLHEPLKNVTSKTINLNLISKRTKCLKDPYEVKYSNAKLFSKTSS
eukprot:maker-scaffold_4-snap-gene-21.5-mRNA-1 protein AED:0.13 eAED:0.13 QI:270/1/1/1/1/1/2/348/419